MRSRVLLVPFLISIIVLISANTWADTISLNFSESTNQEFSGEQNIGPFASNSSFWNNTTNRDSGELKAGSMFDLVDDTGAGTGVNVTWNSSNLWWAGNTSDDEHRMAVGYLDDGDSGSGNGVEITFANIPYAAYRVYGLVGSDNTSPPFNNFKVNNEWVFGGDATTTIVVYGTIDTNMSNNGEYWTQIVPGDDNVIGNYWAIEASGDTCTIIGLKKNDDARGSLTAVIIEEFDPLVAINPSPSDGQDKVSLTPTLTWQQHEAAIGQNVMYEVYMDTDPNFPSGAVKTTGSNPADFHYTPAALDYNKTYYWQVNTLEPNDVGYITHDGDLWSFLTIPESVVIMDQTPSMTVEQGTDEVQLSVSGLNITSYQWYKDGSPLFDDVSDTEYIGEDGPVLTIYDVQVVDEGVYSCEVSNSNSVEATANIQLITKRLAGWWKLDGNLSDSVAVQYPDAVSHDGLSNDPNFVVAGIDAGAIEFFGDLDGLVTIDDSVEFFNFYARGYTVGVWINVEENSSWQGLVSKQSDDGQYGFILSQSGGLPILTMRENLGNKGTEPYIDNSQWHWFVGSYDAENSIVRIYVDGQLKGEWEVEDPAVGSSADLFFGAEKADGSVAYTGLMDDIRIWSYPLEATQVALKYIEIKPDEEICLENPEFDVAGPDGIGKEYVDCRVNMYDFAAFAQTWMDCNIVPTCIN